MKVIQLASMFMLLILSSNVVAEDRVPENAPEWLLCVSKEKTYEPWQKIFISLKNRQVWGTYTNSKEAAGLFGSGLTVHKIKYSFSHANTSSTAQSAHIMNGYIDSDHVRFTVGIFFNYLEIARVEMANDLILNTPTVEYYNCSITNKPRIITNYEKEYLKPNYLDKYTN